MDQGRIYHRLVRYRRLHRFYHRDPLEFQKTYPGAYHLNSQKVTWALPREWVVWRARPFRNEERVWSNTKAVRMESYYYDPVIT